MARNIRNPETEQLAGELPRQTGESRTEAITKALRDRTKRSLADELKEIADHCASLPDLDTRSADEILGYDDTGLPH